MINGTFTRNALREGLTLYCGYCAIEDAIRALPEIGHNYGVYGWNCTVYAAGQYAVVTGYRPAGRYRMTANDIERLNAAARRCELWGDKYTAVVETIAQIYWEHLEKDQKEE